MAWLPRKEEKSFPVPTDDGKGTLRFVNGMSAAEQ